MRRVVKRLPLATPSAVALASVLVLSTGSAGASPDAAGPGAQARAYAIQVTVPGQAGASRASVASPPGPTVAFSAGFSYGDAAQVTTGALTASASTDVGTSASASASANVSGLSLFGGEVTAASVTGRARGYTRGRNATGDLNGATVSGLTVLGQPVTASPGGRVDLGDWGYAITLEQSTVESTTGGAASYHAAVTALDIHLTADHGGLPAGTEIQLGYADAFVQAALTPPKPLTPPGGAPKAKRKGTPAAPEPKRGGPRGTTPIAPVPQLHAKLTAGGYVFPVYGPSSFSDTFGAFRGDVPGNWHHGDDIFAPLGAPVLAVADGTVFSVGWNDVGGNRLWLMDEEGNQFYYAHLSAYTPLAKNGKRVRAGEVLGFVGNTGDAAGTPFHLHFEIHPVKYLDLGYDGAVDPTQFLLAWKHLQDVRFAAVAGWVPSVLGAAAPKAGAILLQVSDISQADGLDPASLRRVLRAPPTRVISAGNLRVS
jgi:hypothetical protein